MPLLLCFIFRGNVALIPIVGSVKFSHKVKDYVNQYWRVDDKRVEAGAFNDITKLSRMNAGRNEARSCKFGISDCNSDDRELKELPQQEDLGILSI